MSAALVVLWLGSAGTRESHEPDLESWASSRMVEIEEPTAAGGLEPATHDDALALRVEALLSEARTATYSADPAASTAPLDDAEALLRAHPALPEAGFLMAETWRARAEAVRPTDTATAVALEQRAATIDGLRAPSFAETPAVTKMSRPAKARQGAGSGPGVTSSTASSATTVALQGARPGDEVEIDGTRVGYPPTVARGTHHVRVLREGQVAWSGWVDAAESPTTLPIPPPAPCDETDLGTAVMTADRPQFRGEVLCPHFVVARPATDGIEVAICWKASCGAFLPWHRDWGEAFQLPVHPPWPEPSRRAWIPWTAAAVTAIVGGGIILIETGAFERHGRPQDTFVWVPPPPSQ